MTDWRHAAAAEAFRRAIDAAPPDGPALVLRDPSAEAARALEEEGLEVERWDRIQGTGARVSPWPPAGPFATAALRLPRSKEELEMLLHGAASALRPGGTLLVYGAKDEGIRSASSLVEPLFGPVVTLAVKSRCRVLGAERPDTVAGLRQGLEAWRKTFRLELAGEVREWVSYPGLFSHGRLDPGTAFLLDALAAPSPGLRVLDFGCGSGILGGALRAREPSLEVELLDVDAVALEAARQNVPGAPVLLSEGLDAAGDPPYDWIVSNPPYHRSKAQTLDVVRRLVQGAPGRLVPGGRLTLVVQRRLPVEEALRAAFPAVEILAADGTYRVWQARLGRRG